MVDEVVPDIGELDEAALILRSQAFVVDRELLVDAHADLIKGGHRLEYRDRVEG
ncbi:hypothetical protein ACTMU2_15380 [Cupriavidus basilensis]